MDGTPQLLTDVKFSQHRRGYDPDEVDNFLERVSAAVAQLQDKLRQATERAELADAQLAEARRLQADGGAGVGSGPEADAELKKVLLLAQRAADQAVSEADESAAQTLTDARRAAEDLLGEAEAERDRMIDAARTEADALAEERARNLRDQVAALETAKGDLEADLATLDEHLAGETQRLRAQLDLVREALDDPRGLRLAVTPALNDTPAPDLPPDDEPPPAAALGPSSSHRRSGRGEAIAGDAGGGRSTEGEDSTLPVRDTLTPWVFDPDDAGPAQEGGTGDEPAGTLGDRGGDTVAIDLTASDLHDDPDGEGRELPTGLFTMGDDPDGDDPTLGEPDPAADAAMRAFFEQDRDDAGSTGRPRFGRRR